MPIESEIKLEIPNRHTAGVARHPLLASTPATRRTLHSVYLDTPEHALRQAGLCLRLRHCGRQWLLTVKRAAAGETSGFAERDEWEWPIARDPSALLAWLAAPHASAPPWAEQEFSPITDRTVRRDLAAVRNRLAPVFQTRFSRSAWRIHHGVSDIEVALDRGRVVAGPRQHPICELELELLHGNLGDLFALARALQAELPLRLSGESKAARGYRLHASPDPAAVRAPRIVLTGDRAPRAAFQQVAQSCLAHFMANERIWRQTGDPEALHQLRVAVRRLRTALRVWRAELPEGFTGRFASAWRDLAAILGNLRRLDVFVNPQEAECSGEIPQRPEYGRIRRQAVSLQRQHARQAAAALHDPALDRWLLDFVGELAGLGGFSAPSPARPASVGGFLQRQARRLFRRLQGEAAALARSAATGCERDRAFHRVRILGKRLRYTLEFGAALWAPARFRRLHLPLCRLLDHLGDLNDRVEGRAVLRSLQGGRSADWLDGYFSGQAAALRERCLDELLALRDAPAPRLARPSSRR